MASCRPPSGGRLRMSCPSGVCPQTGKKSCSRKSGRLRDSARRQPVARVVGAEGSGGAVLNEVHAKEAVAGKVEHPGGAGRLAVRKEDVAAGAGQGSGRIAALARLQLTDVALGIIDQEQAHLVVE